MSNNKKLNFDALKGILDLKVDGQPVAVNFYDKYDNMHTLVKYSDKSLFIADSLMRSIVYFHYARLYIVESTKERRLLLYKDNEVVHIIII